MLSIPTEIDVSRYLKEFTGAMALYLGLLAASLILLTHFADASPWIRAPLALMPIIPCGLMCWVVVREMRRIDELQLRIQFEALGFAFAATALSTFSYGFLQNVGLPQISWLMIWPLMGAMWILGLMIARRRYR